MKKQIKSIKDLTPDPRNANKHTRRGMALLEKSLTKYGAGRSILAASDGVVLAGNATLEEAASAGMPVRVVETDGRELVVVQRTDLASDSKEARGLKIADNRIAELNLEWDSAVLEGEMKDGIPVEEFFDADEMSFIRVEEHIAAAEGGEANYHSALLDPNDVFSPSTVESAAERAKAKVGGTGPDPITVAPGSICPTCGQLMPADAVPPNQVEK